MLPAQAFTHSTLFLTAHSLPCVECRAGAPCDEVLEANFLHPLFRETLPSVIPRLLHIDTRTMSDIVNSDIQNVCLHLSMLCGAYLDYCWRSTSEFQTGLDTELRQDLVPSLSLLSCHLFNPNNSYMHYNKDTLTGSYNWGFEYALPLLLQIPSPPSAATTTAADADATSDDAVSGAGSADRVSGATEEQTGEEDGEEEVSNDDGAAAAAADEQLLPACNPEHMLLVGLINCFGFQGGFAALLGALTAPDRLGVVGIEMLISVFSHVGQYLTPQWKTQTIRALTAVLQYVNQGFQASLNDFSAFEEEGENGGGGGGGGDGHTGTPIYTSIAKILHAIRDTGNAVFPQPDIANSLIAPLQQDLTLRLLRSGNFTRQLAAVKELCNMYCATINVSERIGAAAGAATDDQLLQMNAGSLSSFINWVNTERIVDQILRTNLHQSQYAEAAQRVLVYFTHHGAVSAEHIAFLWSLIEDPSTFEDIKHNVCAMLGALTPHLTVETQAEVLRRAKEMATSGSTAALTLSLRLMTSIARNDKDCALPEKLLCALCDIVLRDDAPLEAATCSTLRDAFLQYVDRRKPGSEQVTWLLPVTLRCLDALERNEGAVPAAYQLHLILTQVVPVYYPKQVS